MLKYFQNNVLAIWLLHWSNSQHRNNFLKLNAFKLEWWHVQPNMFHDSAFQHEMDKWGEVAPILDLVSPITYTHFWSDTIHNVNCNTHSQHTMAITFSEFFFFIYQSNILRSKLLIVVNFANFLVERTHCSFRNELDICSSVVEGHICRYINIGANTDRQWWVQAWWSPIPYTYPTYIKKKMTMKEFIFHQIGEKWLYGTHHYSIDRLYLDQHCSNVSECG